MSPPVAALEGMGLEEAAVEERDGAEGPAPRVRVRHGAVEGAEEERAQQVAVDLALAGETAVHRFREEPVLPASHPLAWTK